MPFSLAQRALETADQLPPFYHHNNWKLTVKDKKADNSWGEKFIPQCITLHPRAQFQFSQMISNCLKIRFSQRRVGSWAWGSAGMTWRQQRWRAWSCSWSAWCRRCTWCWQSWCRSSTLPPNRTWTEVMGIGGIAFVKDLEAFSRVILILMKFGISISTWFQVVTFCSQISELFLFLLYDLSFRCPYFWSATSSFTL